MKALLTFAFLGFSLFAIAQPERKSVVMGSMTTKPNALLIVNPPNSDQGVLLPQLSTGQRNALQPTSPAEDGLIVFDQTEQSYYYWTKDGWTRLRTGGREGYYSIDPAHFQSVKTERDVRHSNLLILESDNSFATVSREGNGEQIVAPVNIPNGAVLTELTIYYMDAHANNIRISLLRKSFTGNSEELINWETSGSSSNVNNQTFTSFNGKEVIDLANYTYRVVVRFDLHNDEEVDSLNKARQRLYGIRIKYQE
jgi:hypothetical protein